MAITGPAPKPTKLRKLEGVPGHARPINQREPEPTGPLARPEFVSGEAGREWDRAVAAMPPGLYTAADMPVLTVYCLAWVMYRNALAQVGREGMIAQGSMGQKVAHPAIAVAKAQAEIILRASDRLGMSPSARTRLEVRDQPPASKFDGLIGGRGDLRLVK
jgi:P27 family predicted phage terminase small subunit